MPQALLPRHIQWSQALSDVTGATGLQSLRAIVAGARAPHTLAAWRHDRGKQEGAERALALTGPWRAAQLCVLTHARALFDCSTVQIRACDAQSAGAFSVLTPHCAPAAEEPRPPCATPPPRRTPHAHRKHAPAVNTRAHLWRRTGVALVAVPGRSDSMAQTMLSEMGPDMSQWPDDQHVGSWLGLAPKQAIAGGNVRKSRTRKHRNRAAQAFRMAAQSVIRSPGAVGAFSRRLQGRLGPAQARVATAHKIARTVSHLRKHRVPSYDSGAAEYHQRFRERERHSLQKKAAKLGYTLSPASPMSCF
jgi:transposase